MRFKLSPDCSIIFCLKTTVILILFITAEMFAQSPVPNKDMWVTNGIVQTIAVDESSVYIGGGFDKIGDYQQGGFALFTGRVLPVSETKKPSPEKFVLQQNYPNPFNPATVISYALPTSGRVTLRIYDLLGKEVAQLVDEDKPAGNYKASFNASHLASGVYFYKLECGALRAVRKMLLIK